MHNVLARIGLLLAALCLPALADTSLQWTWANPSPSGDAFTTLAFGGGIYVAAGYDGVIYSSTDGTTWSPASSVIGNGGSYVSALYSNGHFVLAGMDAGGSVHMTSSADGVHWSDKALSFQFDPHYFGGFQLVSGNGTFILMTANGEAASSDAVSWTVRSPGFAPIIGLLAYANGTFIAAGSNTGASPYTIFYSSDNGVTWSPSASMTNVPFNVIRSNGSSFFAYDINLKAYTSTDGNHWAQQALSGNPPLFESPMLWDGTRFVSIDISFSGQGLPNLFTSPDGLAWTQGASLSGPRPHTAVVTPSGYVANGAGPLEVLKSADFATWTDASAAASATTADLADVVHGSSGYVAVGNGAILHSPDGITWTSVYSSGASLKTVVYGNGAFVAQGGGVWLESSDGIHWNPVATPPAPADSDVVYGAGRFVAFTGNCPSGCAIATSSDGQTWTDHPVPFDLTNDSTYYNIGYDGTRFVSIGESSGGSTGTVYTSCDGINWVRSADISPTPGTFYRLQEVGGTLVALGTFRPACDGGPSQCSFVSLFPVIATTHDTVTWNVATSRNGDYYGSTLVHDVVSDGRLYYDVDLSGRISTSSDAQAWSTLSGLPQAAYPAAIVANGTQLVAVGHNGTIITATLPGSAAPAPGGACKPLPEVGGAGRGEINLFMLIALLGLCAARRRSGA